MTRTLAAAVVWSALLAVSVRLLLAHVGHGPLSAWLFGIGGTLVGIAASVSAEKAGL